MKLRLALLAALVAFSATTFAPALADGDDPVYGPHNVPQYVRWQDARERYEFDRHHVILGTVTGFAPYRLQVARRWQRANDRSQEWNRDPADRHDTYAKRTRRRGRILQPWNVYRQSGPNSPVNRRIVPTSTRDSARCIKRTDLNKKNEARQIAGPRLVFRYAD